MNIALLLALSLSLAHGKICRVTDYGALGDNTTEDTAALQSALDACTPGTTIFPAPGKYLSRSLNLTGKSDIELVIEGGATLVLWGDIDTWNTTGVFLDFLTNTAFHPAALLRSSSTDTTTTNITIHGGGVIDGQGWRWWPFMKTRPRPRLVSMEKVVDFTLSNLTLLDSPGWNTNLRGAFMEITHMTVLSNAGSCSGWLKAPNTDGFNLGGHDILLQHNFVHNGDDCIPIFAFNGEDTYNIHAENVTCNCGTNGGVVILGDDDCGGAHASIYNVTFKNMTVNGTNQGAGVKICEAYMVPHGVIRDITWEDYIITNPRNTAMYTNVIVEDGCTVPTNLSRTDWLTTERLTFKGIRADVPLGVPAGCFVCTDEKPCTGMVFEDVVVTSGGKAATPYVCANAQGTSQGSSPQPC